MTGALVHEWISKSGGSERVFETLGDTFPDADLYCLWNDSDNPAFRNVSESWIARTPLRGSKIAAMPAMLMAWRQIVPRRDYSWMMVSSHLFAHHARFGGRHAREIPKFVYVHTPARYVWVPELDGRGSSPAARAVSRALKPIDRRRAHEADGIIANSNFVRQRIRDTWHLDADVIHPPVRVNRLQAVRSWRDQLSGAEEDLIRSMPSEFILGASRFVSYKNLDLVIRAGESAGVPVVIAGSGPDESRLRSLAESAAVPVSVVVSPSDALLFCLLQEATAFVFPAIEDFGIMPVEAQALGTPTIVNVSGGASESVVAGRTGVAIQEFSGPDFKQALDAAQGMSPTDCSTHARSFESATFATNIRTYVEERVK